MNLIRLKKLAIVAIALNLSGQANSQNLINIYGNNPPPEFNASNPNWWRVQSSPCIPAAAPWVIGGNMMSQYSPITEVGTCNEYDFILKAFNMPLIFMKTNRLVGIGPNNNSPNAQLDVSDGINYGNGFEHTTFSGDKNGVIQTTSDMNLSFGISNAFYLGGGVYNNNFTPQFSLIGGKIGVGTGYGNLNSKITIESGSFDGILNRTGSNTTKACSLVNTGNNMENFVIYGSGKTHIGAGRPLNNGIAANAMLTVDGMILAKDIRVAISTTTHWMDLVFEKNYNLMKLSDVEAFVWKEKHLPFVPSEAEVRRDGIDLVDINIKLLQKVEELYLYTFELNKRIKQQEELLKTLIKN